MSGNDANTKALCSDLSRKAAHSHLIREDYVEAERLYTQLLKLLENTSDMELVFVTLCNRSSVYLKLELPRKALSDATRAKEIYPDNQMGLIRIGDALRGLGREAEAIDMFRKASESIIHLDVSVELFKRMGSLFGGDEGSLRQETTPTPIVPKTSTKMNNESNANAILQRDMKSEIELSKGFELVNKNKLNDAIALFTSLIQRNKQLWAALLGRGTAWALVPNLVKAESDLTKCVECNPNYADAYKRRAQIYGALDRYDDAIEDYLTAERLMNLETSKSESSKSSNYDIATQLGILYQRKRHFRRARDNFKRAMEDMKGTDSDEKSKEDRKMLLFYRGVCENTLGNVERALVFYNEALKIDPTWHKVMSYMGQAYKDWGFFEESRQHFTAAIRNLPCTEYYIQMGQLNYLSGRIIAAKEVFERALTQSPKDSTAMYMYALCLHGLGDLAGADRAYSRLLEVVPDHVGGFNRECCRYQVSKMDADIESFSMDVDISAHTKEGWCRKDPFRTLKSQHRQPVPTSTTEFSYVHSYAPTCEQMITSLAEMASSLGRRLQYTSPGFLRNIKQHRMAGMAIIDVAQSLHSVWRGAVYVPKGGVSTGVRSTHIFGWRDMFDRVVRWRQFAEPNDSVWWVDRLSKKQFDEGFGSHTPMLVGQTLVARYHAYLPRAITLLQELVPAQLEVSSSLMVASPPLELSTLTLSSTSKRAIPTIPTSTAYTAYSETHEVVDKLYDAIRHDFYVVTSCHSSLSTGKVMEGTRLTVQISPPEGYEVSIRTPSTPARWREYDEELQQSFTRLSNHVQTIYKAQSSKSHDVTMQNSTRSPASINTHCRLCAKSGRPTSLPPLMKHSHVRSYSEDNADSHTEIPSHIHMRPHALTHAHTHAHECTPLTEAPLPAYITDLIPLALNYVFYWFNFMPLARGTAMCGFIALHAIFLSVGYEISQPLTEGMQLDWEAILCPSPQQYIQLLLPWLKSSLRPTRMCGFRMDKTNVYMDEDDCENRNCTPVVSHVVPTLREMIRVLNMEGEMEADVKP